MLGFDSAINQSRGSRPVSSWELVTGKGQLWALVVQTGARDVPRGHEVNVSRNVTNGSR